MASKKVLQPQQDSSTAVAVDIDLAKSWINDILTLTGHRGLVIPESVADTATLQTSVDKITKKLGDDGDTSEGDDKEVQTQLSLNNKLRSKARQLGLTVASRKLTDREARFVGRQAAKRPY